MPRGGHASNARWRCGLFLDGAGRAGASRRFLQGDASTRRFERVRDADESAVLMDWEKPAAPPVRDSRAAYRAQDVRAVVATGTALAEAGFSTPAVLAADIERGFLLQEDFGTAGIAPGDAPDAERYGVAVELLAAIHAKPRASALPMPGGGEHRLLTLSDRVLAADLTLFTDWSVPHATGRPIEAAAARDFTALWRALFDRLRHAQTSWVLFDVQSPNLFWLPDRQGLRRIGLIDFQDMFVGPAAYDVASLCQDARVTIPPALEADLRARYVGLRRECGPVFR